jgi:hypothetical protein
MSEEEKKGKIEKGAEKQDKSLKKSAKLVGAL